MIEIIKPGNVTHIKICSRCGCEYSYELTTDMENQCGVEGTQCPCCNNFIPHETMFHPLSTGDSHEKVLKMNTFEEGCKEIKGYMNVLNWYRNLYYKESMNTEQGIMAKAINDMFMKAKKLGVLNALNEEGKATMTEFDIIKSLDIDHMAEWLSNTWDCNLCSENQRLSDNPFCSDEYCDNRCIDHCKEWLMSEVNCNE